tara:strand:+ start:5065 stop:5586 length:522 start_codon:yes stop_codon:yes gene_type:complete
MKKSQISPLPVILGLLIIWLVYQLHLQSNQQDSLYEIIQPSVFVMEIESDDEDEPYRDDIYRRPVRRPPFNYPTRGPPGEYDRVGFLQDPDDPNKLQELFGRPTYPNSNNWNYFVKSDQYHQIPIPVTMNGKNCTDETGCTELNNQESINLFNKQHTATIYKPEPYYYNPYVV